MHKTRFPGVYCIAGMATEVSEIQCIKLDFLEFIALQAWQLEFYI